MNCIIWNIRGVGNDVSIGRVKFLIRTHQLDCIVLLEPKINTDRLDKICRRLGMDKAVANTDGMAHVWVLWKDPLQLSVVYRDE